MLTRSFATVTAFTAIVLVALAGCSSSPNGAGPSGRAPSPNARPAGCERTECDVNFDACMGNIANMPGSCSACISGCRRFDARLLVQCVRNCTEVCRQPSSSPSGDCEDEKKLCEKGPQNEACVDGMAPANLPGYPVSIGHWVPPAVPHRGRCTNAQLDGFVVACGANGSTKTCAAFRQSLTASCNSCIVTQSPAATWGPVVQIFDVTLYNDVGCVAAIDGDTSDTGCGAKLLERIRCLTACSHASDRDACIAFVTRYDCAPQVEAAAVCIATLGLDRTGTPFDVCAFDQSDDVRLRSLVGFFCGAPSL